MPLSLTSFKWRRPLFTWSDRSLLVVYWLLGNSQSVSAGGRYASVSHQNVIQVLHVLKIYQCVLSFIKTVVIRNSYRCLDRKTSLVFSLRNKSTHFFFINSSCNDSFDEISFFILKLVHPTCLPTYNLSWFSVMLLFSLYNLLKLSLIQCLSPYNKRCPQPSSALLRNYTPPTSSPLSSVPLR